MAGRSQPIPWHEQAEELYARYRETDDVAQRKRLQVLWELRRGASIRAAARAAGVGERTAIRWLDWYRQGGLLAVLARVPGRGARGQPSRLTPQQQQALLEQVGRGAFHTYHDARRWVEQTFGVVYKYQGMYSLLARLDVHPRVPRPMVVKADPAAQEAWTKGGLPER